MGWTYFDKGRQTTKQWFEKHLTCDLRDWVNAPKGTPFDQCPLVGKQTCLKSSVGLRVGYAAVKSEYFPGTGHRKAGTTEVWAAVYLFGHTPKDPLGYTFGYKDMDESMGPNERKCPKDILDLLTPLPPVPQPATYADRLLLWGIQAGLWGEDECPPVPKEDDLVAALPDPYQFARWWRQDCRNYLAEKGAKPKVSKGCLVRFENPISFLSGPQQVLRWSGKGGLFFDPRYGMDPYDGRYRIRKWRERSYSVVKEAA